MIIVIATIELVEGVRDEFLEAFHELVPRVLEEEGCLEYGPAVDVPTMLPAQGPVRDDVVTVVEKWENVAALEQHLVAAHMSQYRRQVKPLVRSTSLQILEPA